MRLLISGPEHGPSRVTSEVELRISKILCKTAIRLLALFVGSGARETGHTSSSVRSCARLQGC